ncbi:MAG: efflux RND transporter periplasmic adaptor subunit [Pseudomonadaceae bacterium]|nr:efflux RND transporter periplasmic adaptor subunit [Pseudomonadaceae bacterium]
MHLPFRPTFLVTLLASALLIGCDQQGSPTAPSAAAPIQEVSIVTLVSKPVALHRELSGRTHPFLIAEVRPQVSGIVEQRLFTEGALVEEGQPLYQLDNALYLAELNSAKASLQRAEASLSAAQRVAKRAESLRATGAISQQGYDDAVTGLEEARASLAVAKATVQSRQVTLNNARVTAPISGKISISEVTRGALVTANQPQALTTIQQLDPLYIDVTQSSAEWLKLQRQFESGALSLSEDVAVRITLEDGSRYPHAGRMTLADVTVNPSTGSFALRAEVPNPDHLLLPGMYVRARINMGTREAGLLVPQRSVARDARGDTFVMLVDADNKIERRTIVVNQALGDQWLVDSGVEAGDRIVVAGLQKIRPGATVKTVKAE